MGKFLRKPSSSARPGAGGGELSDAAFTGRFPALAEALSLSRWEDGSSRVPSSLLLFVEDGRWKCCLNDRDAQRVAFLTAESLQDLLGAVEQGLVEDRLDWRRSAQGKAKR